MELQVTAAGDVFLGGAPVALEHLAEALTDDVLDPESTVIVFMADENATHGLVVKIMDLLRRHGFKRVVLAARWEHEGQER